MPNSAEMGLFASRAKALEGAVLDLYLLRTIAASSLTQGGDYRMVSVESMGRMGRTVSVRLDASALLAVVSTMIVAAEESLRVAQERMQQARKDLDDIASMPPN